LRLSSSSRAPQPAPGSIVTVARDGGRPLLIELQALVDRMRFWCTAAYRAGTGPPIAWRCCFAVVEPGTRACRSRNTTCSVQRRPGGIQIGETAPDLPVLIQALAST